MVDDKNKKKPGDKMTPEEKLFKVIATGGKDYRFTEETTPPEDLDQDPFSRLENVWKRFRIFISEDLPYKAGNLFKSAGLGRTQQTRSAVVQTIPIRTINLGLLVIVGILILYLVMDMLFNRNYPSTIKSESELPAHFKISDVTVTMPNVQHYLTPATNRNVFMPPRAPAQGQGPAPASGFTGPVAPPVNYKLVGISWDDQEFVAMLEVDGDKGAHFVRKGDSVQGGAKVEEIKEYSVTLSMGEQKWELT